LSATRRRPYRRRRGETSTPRSKSPGLTDISTRAASSRRQPCAVGNSRDNKRASSGAWLSLLASGETYSGVPCPRCRFDRRCLVREHHDGGRSTGGLKVRPLVRPRSPHPVPRVGADPPLELFELEGFEACSCIGTTDLGRRYTTPPRLLFGGKLHLCCSQPTTFPSWYAGPQQPWG